MCVCASAGLGRREHGRGGTNPFMKSAMYTDSRVRAGSHGGFAWFFFAPPRPRLKIVVVHCQSPVGLYTYLYILCVCVCIMLAGVSFFRNRIRKDVLHPTRPVPVVFHYLISSSASALSAVVKPRFRKNLDIYILYRLYKSVVVCTVLLGSGGQSYRVARKNL